MSTTHQAKGQSASPKGTPAQAQGAMQAIALGPDGASLTTRKRPGITATTDVLVEVQSAGLCRTDLYVASGQIAASPGTILGHEASGIVQELGPAAANGDLRAGALVGIDPRIPCGQCASCDATPSPNGCLAPKQLGIDLDGVFAEFIVVPACCLYPMDAGVSLLRAAYLEPVAAAMGALTAGLTAQDMGVIAGTGRIPELTARVLEHAGIPRPRVMAPEALDASVRPGTLDFVIDAGLPNDDALAAMTGTLRKGGTLVLKSRAARSRSFMPADWVAREINVAARSYGTFDAAARAVADERLVLEDLFGAPQPLSEFERVFNDARAAERVKQFFQVSKRTASGVTRVH